jgi:hypothetical protein
MCCRLLPLLMMPNTFTTSHQVCSVYSTGTKPILSYNSVGPWAEGGGLDPDVHHQLPRSPAVANGSDVQNGLVVQNSCAPAAAIPFLPIGTIGLLPNNVAVPSLPLANQFEHQQQQQHPPPQLAPQVLPIARPNSLYPIMSLNPIRNR